MGTQEELVSTPLFDMWHNIDIAQKLIQDGQKIGSMTGLKDRAAVQDRLSPQHEAAKVKVYLRIAYLFVVSKHPLFDYSIILLASGSQNTSLSMCTGAVRIQRVCRKGPIINFQQNFATP